MIFTILIVQIMRFEVSIFDFLFSASGTDASPRQERTHGHGMNVIRAFRLGEHSFHASVGTSVVFYISLPVSGSSFLSGISDYSAFGPFLI